MGLGRCRVELHRGTVLGTESFLILYWLLQGKPRETGSRYAHNQVRFSQKNVSRTTTTAISF